MKIEHNFSSPVKINNKEPTRYSFDISRLRSHFQLYDIIFFSKKERKKKGKAGERYTNKIGIGKNYYWRFIRLTFSFFIHFQSPEVFGAFIAQNWKFIEFCSFQVKFINTKK